MFWINVLVLNLMIPVIMLLIGVFHLMMPPKERNFLYGYCSKRSTSSQEAWKFAQRCFGNLCCYGGIGSIALALLMMLAVVKSGDALIRKAGSVLGVLEALLMIGAFVATENILKKKFDV